MLALQQQKLVKYSLKFFVGFALIAGATSYVENISLVVLLGGLVLGCFWAVCLPLLWKRNMEIAHTFLTVGLAVFIGTKNGGTLAGFQLIVLGMATAFFIWYLFKSPILAYLQRQ